MGNISSHKLPHLIKKIFQGRIRGKVLTSDFYQTEMPDHISAGVDAATQTSLLGSVLFIFSQNFSLLLFFCLIFFLWKISHASYLGWNKLQKLHKTIKEEQWEIEHHVAQERKELEKLYQAKGLSGKLLEEVVNILMADQNRLLQIMLEEEMGLSLGSYEHPLKQGFGAGIGVLFSSFLFLLGFFIFPPWSLFISTVFVFLITGTISAKYEQRVLSSSLIWNLSLCLFILSCSHFLTILLKTFFPS